MPDGDDFLPATVEIRRPSPPVEGEPVRGAMDLEGVVDRFLALIFPHLNIVAVTATVI
jgi:hypothetical protein